MSARSSFRERIRAVAQKVADGLGTAHSESIYQKAFAAQLQADSIPHQCEYHTPVVYYTNATTFFHIGDERIDILAYDPGTDEVHVVELKAISARVSPPRPVGPTTVLPAAHAQLCKYIRNLKTTLLKDRVVEGHVINFCQKVTCAEQRMEVEFDTFDALKMEWDWE